MKDAILAGVELGGTKAIAVLAQGREILDLVRFPTKGPDVTLAALRRQLERWQTQNHISALGIATFGPIDLDPGSGGYGRILSTTKPGWADADIRQALDVGKAIPIRLDTDVAGAALAEGVWGAAVGTRAHAYITIGTGVGGALMSNGELVHGNAHSEVGHMKIPRDTASDFAGICPFHGDCLEGLVSGPAIAAQAGRPAETLPDDHPIWPRVARNIGSLVMALFSIGAPDKVLLGGGVISGKEFLIEMIRDEVAEASAGYFVGLSRAELMERISAPALGELAGPLGAIALARSADMAFR